MKNDGDEGAERSTSGEAEERNRLLLEHSGMGIGYYDLEGTILLLNRRACEHLADDASAFVGRSAVDVFGPEVGRMIVERIRSVSAGGQAQVFEDEVELPTGRKFFRAVYSPVPNADGDIVGVQIAAQDISGEKRAERALVTQHEELQWLAEFDRIVLSAPPRAVTGEAIAFLQDSLGLERVSIAVLTPREDALVVFDIKGRADGVGPGATLPLESTVLSEVVGGSQPLYRPDIRQWKTKYKVDDTLIRIGVLSDFLIPLVAAGRHLGTLNAGSSRVDGIPRDKRGLLERIAPRLAQTVRNMQLFAELEESERNLREAQRVAHVGDWRVDLATGQAAWSDELYRILHVDPAEELNLDALVRDIVHPDDREMTQQAVRDALETGELPPFEFRVVRPDGEERVLWSKGSVTRDNAGVPVVFSGINQDITERKRAEEELRRTSRELRVLHGRMVRLREEERLSLARALHDMIGTELSALGLGIGAATIQAGQGESRSVVARLEKLAEQVERVTGMVRHFLTELRPSVLADYGLVAAVRALGERIAEQSGMDIRVGGCEHTRLPAGTETALYRIVQEALANAAKHAGARHVVIAMEDAEHGMRLSVRDDGCGFNVGEARPVTIDSGMGLIDMRERAVGIGAQFSVHSAPGEGTEIVLEVKHEDPDR